MHLHAIKNQDGYRRYTDAELMQLLKQSDSEAFTEIYNRYWMILYTHVYKMLRDEEETKDSVQEIFSKLWLRSDQLTSNENLGGYLFRSARNQVFNIIEKRQVRRNHMRSMIDYFDRKDASVVDSMDGKRIQQLIDLEIQKLPPRMRRIFELSRKDELTHQEIAEELNLSYQTVKKQVQKALKIIKPRLKHLSLWWFTLFFLS